MFARIFVVVAAMAAYASAFQVMPKITRSSKISMSFNLDRVISKLSSNRILTKTAQLGLLTRLENAGFTLTTAADLLIFADENDLIGVLEASSDKVLPLIATGVDLAPSLLPLAAVALKTPPTAFFGGALASLAAAAGVVLLIPDDSVVNVALQAALVVPLGVLLPGGLGLGGVVLSKLK